MADNRPLGERISGEGVFINPSKPRPRRYSYDQACADLAFYFLTDGRRELGPDDEPVKELAQAIQDVCEAHCRDFERGDR